MAFFPLSLWLSPRSGSSAWIKEGRFIPAPGRYAILEGDEYGDDAFSAHDLFDHVIDPVTHRAKKAEDENARLREQNKRLQQKCKSLANNAVTDDDLQQIINTAEKAPGGFAKGHEYGAVNVIGKAQLGKDLSCCIRLCDLSFFSNAKATIRKLVNEVCRLRQQEAARRAVAGEGE